MLHKYIIIVIDTINNNTYREKASVIMIIIIMVIFKCYFSGEHIALSIKKKQQQRCEHIIRKNQQIKSTEHDAN